MEIGSLRCIFCKQRADLDGYPWVGSIIQCDGCLGYQMVIGHYLEFNDHVTMKISSVPRIILDRLNKILADGR